LAEAAPDRLRVVQAVLTQFSAQLHPLVAVAVAHLGNPEPLVDRVVDAVQVGQILIRVALATLQTPPRLKVITVGLTTVAEAAVAVAVHLRLVATEVLMVVVMEEQELLTASQDHRLTTLVVVVAVVVLTVLLELEDQA
jgi:uncharacterized iron-regulated protein